ncbi:RNA methyltransferase [Agaribacter marinus]|uniref:RNA methyltransferase TrmH n=1 Tax=Agaribacter marinus TaxID=1431249 RepID=A0AA37T758_9ALTE|nr:RNA methyltransferase [Agaribacter marinus]GLR72760.1 RNA methyltransferase TrmH [Agaribacter marinus]
MPFSIGLVNPKAATNVAAILRSAGCFGASSIFYTGQRFGYAKDNNKDFAQDTQNFRKQIPTVGVDDLLAYKPDGAISVVIELVENAIALPEFKHPENAYYIFGPEDGSVSQTLVDEADHVVFIPCRSNLNLAATASVLFYDRLCKLGYDKTNNAVRQARDKNNTLAINSP